MAHGIQLNWTASAPQGATFKVYRSTVAGQEGLIAQGLNTNTYLDTDVVPGTDYFYKVSFILAGQESPKSNEVDAVAPNQFDAPVLTATVV